jgi:hypothetical protein
MLDKGAVTHRHAPRARTRAVVKLSPPAGGPGCLDVADAAAGRLVEHRVEAIMFSTDPMRPAAVAGKRTRPPGVFNARDVS